MFKKTISLIVSFSLFLTQPIFAQGAAELNIGKYLRQLPNLNTDRFRPPHLRYISYDIKSNDFKLLLDQGDAKLSNSTNSQTPELNQATQELFNYFLIGLSLPNDKFWVNLRPDAPEQIIDPEIEKTDLGKIMLEADLQLKKDTAGLTSPQNPEGKEYWNKLYKKAGELFGSENITIPTITRPWIVPGEVIIRESEDSSYIYKANLKVMLEEDYLSSQLPEPNYQPLTSNYNFSDPRMKELNQYSTQLIRELILPKLTQEVNTSKKYAQLRQVFFSLILSRWFKDKFKGRPGQYSERIDSHNLDNLTSKKAWNKDYYFNEYKKSFQQGEYNLKEQITTPTGQVIRSYVSGGIYNLLPNRIDSFKGNETSSPIDFNTIKTIETYLVNVGIGVGIGTVIAALIDLKRAIKIDREKKERKLNIMHDSIIKVLNYADNNKLASDDADLLNEEFKNYKILTLEKTIGIARSVIQRLQLRSEGPTHASFAQNVRQLTIDALQGALNKVSDTTGSSPLTVEEALKSLEEYKKEIQGFPLKYLKEGQKRNNLESLLRAYFLNSQHNENIAIAAGYLSTIAREELYNFTLSQEWEKKQIKIAEIVAALTVITSEQKSVSPLTLEDARARLDKMAADYRTRINSFIEEVEAKAAKSAKLLLLQKLTSCKKLAEDTDKMNKGSLSGIGISVIDMIHTAEDKYIPETDAAIEDSRNKEEALKILQGGKETMEKFIRELNNLEQDISAFLYSEKEEEISSLPLTQEERDETGTSSAITHFREITDQTINILEEIYREREAETALKALESIKTSLDKDEQNGERVKILFDIINTMHKAYLESREDQQEQLAESYEDVWNYLYNAAEQGKVINARNSIAKIKQFIPKVIDSIKRKPKALEEIKKYVDFRENKEGIVVDNIRSIGDAIITLKAIFTFMGDYDRALELDKMLLEDVWCLAIERDYDNVSRRLELKASDKNEICLGLLYKDRGNWLDRKKPIYGYHITTTLRKFGTSSAIVQELSGLKVKTALEQEVGGIDFTRINYLTQPMGSFQGLDLRLPLLSKQELEEIDISRELAAVEQMINAKIDVSTDRLKCLLSAMSQKGAFNAQRETQLLPLLLRLCCLKEERGVNTTPDFRAVLLIADTGLFL